MFFWKHTASDDLKSITNLIFSEDVAISANLYDWYAFIGKAECCQYGALKKKKKNSTVCLCAMWQELLIHVQNKLIKTSGVFFVYRFFVYTDFQMWCCSDFHTKSPDVA